MEQLNIKQLLNRSFLLTVIIFSCAFCANAQTKPKKTVAPKTDTAKVAVAKTSAVIKSPANYIDAFFKKYKTSADSAIDYIFGTNKLFGTNYQITLLKMKLDSLRVPFGKYTGKELIAQKTASPSLVLYTYLVKHENQPMRFTFMFYRAQNEWVLYRFNYDDQLDTELIEAAKINNKRP